MKNLIFTIVGIALLIASCNDKGSEFDPCEDFYNQNAGHYNADCGGCAPGGNYLAFEGECFKVWFSNVSYYILESPLHDNEEMLLEISSDLRIRVIDSLFSGSSRIQDIEGERGAYAIDAFTYVADNSTGIGYMQMYFKDDASSLDFNSDEVEVELAFNTDGVGLPDTSIVTKMYRAFPSRE